MFMSPQWQFDHLQDMAGDVNEAWENEMDSRVAQSREDRRMEHERWIEMLRQDTALRKIAAEQQMAAWEMRLRERNRRISEDRKAGITFSTEWGKY